ncbi:glycosyltransferase family 2 protein [Dyadobacter sp. CY356]|uniref:glycosyltransferase family 2 protein n=1 Tax=Dyadobacter sp. CY356 TaxID=2906442 RepID=UPI001F3136C4|nr:glycosyltransferase family 2 protein [Dyadobacter sp. CY356]MCF0055159.1 glycosyltransferase family 2 protein [Dyadobacter sp. CY356]
MIEILLSTYNGERYLSSQFESILRQTFTDWKITIRDDGSLDKTVSIIKDYISKYPEKIQLLEKDGIRLGSTLSFAKLIENSKAEYVMLCDQDDVWMDKKIEITFDAMKKLEEAHPDKPLLIFTDLTEVDSELNIIANSFIKNQKLNPAVAKDPYQLLALNVVAGCTTMFNKISKPIILPIRSKHIIHDQWIAINISKHGYIDFVDEATILYRQHGNNAVGSKVIGLKYFLKKASSPVRQIRIYYDLIHNLNFKVNIIKFLFNKVSFSLKRL